MYDPDLSWAVIIASKMFPELATMSKDERINIIAAVQAGIIKGRERERKRLRAFLDDTPATTAKAA